MFEATPAQEWRRNWPTVLAGVLGLALGTIHFYSTGVMIPLLEAEFGWSRAEISYGPMIASIGFFLVSPLVGAALDKYGARPVVLLGMPCYCVVIALLSTITSNILSWCLLWLFLSIVWSTVGTTAWAFATSTVFDRSKGFALAVTLCGTGLGPTLMPPITNYFVALSGWRIAYVALAVFWAVLVIPAVFFLLPARRRVAGASAADAGVAVAGSSASAFASPAFLKIAIAAALISLGASGVFVNMVPILRSEGLPADVAAWVAGSTGIGVISARLAGGLLLDRLPGHLVAGLFALLPLPAAWILLAWPGSVPLSLIAVVMMGFSMGVEVNSMAFLSSRYFPPSDYGKLWGIVSGLLALTSGVGPLAISYVFDATKSYDLALWGLIPTCFVGSVLLLMLGPYPERKLVTAG